MAKPTLRERQEQRATEEEQDKARLAREFGVKRDDKFEKAYALAYERGHSGGDEQIQNEFVDLLPFLNKATDAFLNSAEQAAARVVVELAELYGYQNMIYRLRNAWMLHLRYHNFDSIRSWFSIAIMVGLSNTEAKRYQSDALRDEQGLLQKLRTEAGE